ncbi:hypothetical protein Nepgr_002783 [Nepenthes gracilis]|uniref:S1 motif domain-containing protein n=1 Tax=Nepenthes gracilis TaxID=150966 RepID=A0AAD3P6Y8_NEPGR|nr:hypothetical protein Nepgr_002783 [Nepenthes gracilis]
MFLNPRNPSTGNFQLLKNLNSVLRRNISPPRSLYLFKTSLISKSAHVAFCSPNDVLEEFASTQLSKNHQSGEIQEIEGFELLNKPSPKPINKNGSASELETEPQDPAKDEALAPFLKFFKPRETMEGGGEAAKEDGLELGLIAQGKINARIADEEKSKKVIVEYYDPKPGDFVAGVVVYGNENKLDVNVGADLLGTMLTKEMLPLYNKEMDYLLCDLEKNAEEFMSNGKMGIIPSHDALGGQLVHGRPIVEAGTVLFAEVLGRTLSGRPLLSARRFFRRIAWHRLRQIKQLDEPIEVRITEWNTGGLLTRIEGLRAFLPKAELVNRVNNFTELKENVGRCMYVQISRIHEAKNDLIISEREAWEKVYLQEGVLLEGTVRKIFPYGAQIKIGETNRSGLLHVSNISRCKITSVGDLLTVDEKVKVLVLRPMFPDKISLSIAELESEPGLFITNKERVFAEAEEMASKYREKLPAISAPRKSDLPLTDALPFDDEVHIYANWKWFKFQRENDPSRK